MINRVDMIITDLDNSLLDNKRQISEYTRNILLKCQDNGIIIVFATARPYKRTHILFNLIRPDSVICHCGGYVYK
jgi:hydroxymethylpyrimidine pyrophosphatase-like HAD family hydrolase